MQSRSHMYAARIGIFTALVAMSGVAHATPTIDRPVEARALRGENQRVIIELVDPLVRDDLPVRPGVDVRASREELAVRARDRKERKNRVLQALASVDKVRMIHELESFRLMALELTPNQLTVLRSHPEVVRVHEDRVERATTSSSVPYTGAPSWHSSGVKGQGLTVAVLDTPVRYNNGAFGDCPSPGASGCQVATSVNIAGVDEAALIDLEGPHSHGSNVAGIVLAMAPGAKVAALNVFHWDDVEQDTKTFASDQIAGLDWVAQNAAAYNIVAVNMSIGTVDPYGPCNDDSRYDPIRTLYADHDVVTVISAGNEAFPDAVGKPGCISLAMTVGAQLDTQTYDWCGTGTQAPGAIACFSNRSGMVDIVAPGVGITAGGVSNLSGTSMAAPHIAGAVALLQDNWGAPVDPSSAFWVNTGLRTWAVPQPLGSQRYDSLRLNHPIHWDHGSSFSYWYREAAGNVIPTGGAAYSDTTDVADTDTVDGVYLNLELLHPTPADVRVRVINPQGGAVETNLPSGLSHFNGTLGRTHFPGLFEPLTGGAVTGTWTLQVEDTGSSGAGYFLRAALFFVYSGCTKDCSAATCGDNACGGTCSVCIIDDTCVANGEAHPTDQCLGCIPTKSTSSWSPRNGVSCDDGNPCTVSDSCDNGACAGSPKPCPAPAECKAQGTCQPADGSCQYSDLPFGSPCSGGTCQNGVCVQAPTTGGAAGAAGAAGASGSAGSAGSAGVSGTAGSFSEGGSGGGEPAVIASAPADQGCGCRVPAGQNNIPLREGILGGLAALLLLKRRGRSARRE